MGQLKILTAGESHGRALVGIIEGMPAGVRIAQERIDAQLRKRQGGAGRGGRMKIEHDRAQILSGVRFGLTLGSPISLVIENRDWENWRERMGVFDGADPSPVTVPRPGHADLAGALKYGHTDLRNVIERASARETALRVAIGSVVQQLLDAFSIWIGSHVVRIHTATASESLRLLFDRSAPGGSSEVREMVSRADASEVRTSDREAEKAMKCCISDAAAAGDTVGGMFEVVALSVPVGLGSYADLERRLDAQIAGAFMGIPGVKAVEIGLGVECAGRPGSEVHDPILPGEGLRRGSNRAGGIEGGVGNGEPILVRATMKPIPTLQRPLPSVDLSTGEAAPAHVERSDVCAVPAAAVVGEAMLAIVLGRALCEKYGGDSLDEMMKNFRS
ncbi:MAG: chorismate synthase [Acidobacteriota bacterium]